MATKAQRFAEYAAEHGWENFYHRIGEHEVVIATIEWAGSTQLIWTSWTGNKQVAGRLPYWTQHRDTDGPDRLVKLRNVAEAKAIIRKPMGG